MSESPTTDGAGSVVSLPVLPSKGGGGTVARSRTSKWRFAVLIVIQVLMIIHVVQWLVMGVTFAPLEPSESMETLKNGIVNVGFVLFALAILSTAIFGRYFCGWACHVLLLQDASTKLLNRFGIQPKPFRSRLLVFIPLILALYMFVWPVVYRLAIAPFTRPDLTWPGFTTEFVTTDFWRTFPGVLVAIPFFLVCSFGVVYLMGMKGYCTYACPYGGFFAPADELAPGRIRVNDSCEHCGHCTAVCSSNVRVHEEVRDFGMVVDPGCMKCMDCVSVCPNDALSFGFGRPAIGLDKSEGTPRKYDLSWPEEIGLAIVALITFFSVRGAYGLIPLLFASGITACVVFMTWLSWRTLTRPNTRLHKFQLRLKGSIRPAGWAFVAFTAITIVWVLHTGVVNASLTLAQRYDDRVTIPAQSVFADNPVLMEPEMAENALRARTLYETASFIGDGGIGLGFGWQPQIDLRRAWLHAANRDMEEAERLLRRSIDRYGFDEAHAIGLARVLRASGRDEEAASMYLRAMNEIPDSVDAQEELAAWFTQEERGGELISIMRARVAAQPPVIQAWLDADGADPGAIDAAKRAIRHDPHHLAIVRRLSIALVDSGSFETEIREGIELIERTLEIEPDNGFAWRALALGHGRLEEYDEAIAAMTRAVEVQPDDWRLREAYGQLLMGLGEEDAATEQFFEAQRLQAEE